jgi:hypothetical protein
MAEQMKAKDTVGTYHEYLPLNVYKIRFLT